MDDTALDEATRLGLLERLQAHPAGTEELARGLGISERVLSGLLDRLVVQGVVEMLPGSTAGASHRPVYRLVQRRRSRSRGSGGLTPKFGRPGSLHSPTAASQSTPQHPFMAGMVPFGYAPYHGQHMVYVAAAGISPYQQQPMGPGAPHWARQRMPTELRPLQQQQQQQLGGGVAAGVQLGPIPGQHHMAAFPMHPYYFAAAGGPMPPLTPAMSASSQLRQLAMPRAGSGSTASAGSTGWGGVPLSQSATEAQTGAQPSPCSQHSQHEQNQELPKTLSAANGSNAADPSEPSTADAGLHGGQAQQQPQQSVGEEERLQQWNSDGSSSEEGGEGQQHVVAANSSSTANHGEDGSVGERLSGSSSGGSNGGSRRRRGNRERQPCAFFLKTGTCAYGDSCKFAHPYDKAPKVEFNSLGLPLRPSEPECSFYMKNYRCSFGQTCKFHHPEPPPGVAIPLPVVPSVYALQYPMQYQHQPEGSHMLNSVLGLKPGPGSRPAAMTASPTVHRPAPGFYMAAPHFPGPHAFGARGPEMHPGFVGPPVIPGAAMPRPPPQRSNSNLGNGRTGAATAATAATGALIPAPVPRPQLQQADGVQGVEAGSHLGSAYQATASGSASSSPAATAPDLPPDTAAASPAGMVGGGAGMVGEVAPAVPPPIMVFNSQQQQARKVASALEKLELQTAGAQQQLRVGGLLQAPTSGAGSGSSGAAEGALAAPPHSPRQQADVVAAA